MTFSLRIKNGDLALQNRSLSVVEGPDKLVQDLTCNILTPRRFYENYPEFGTEIESTVIGQSNWDMAMMYVEAEIKRICKFYQDVQKVRHEYDAQTNRRLSQTADEILLRVINIEMKQINDVLVAKVEIETGENSLTELYIPVPSGK